MQKYLKPVGCAVVVIGRHDCISMGAGESNAPEFKELNSTNDDNIYNITPELRGSFKKPEVRGEFYEQIQDWLNTSGGI